MAIYIWFLLYRGTKVYVIGKFERIVAFVVLMMLAFTQTIMMSPFYYMLYFFANSRGKTIKKMLDFLLFENYRWLNIISLMF